jgi:hypothetical protein
MRPASTVKTGVSKLEGIVGWLLERTSCYELEDTIAVAGRDNIAMLQKLDGGCVGGRWPRSDRVEVVS